MTILSLFSVRYAGSETLVDDLCQKTRSRLFRDADILERCSLQHHIRPAVLEKALFAKPSVFNNFTHEKEHAIACLNATLADLLDTEGQIFTGHTALLLPSFLSHALRILITASPAWRIAQAWNMGTPEKEALEEIQKSDQKTQLWTRQIWDGPLWSPDRYHLILAMEQQKDPVAEILKKMEDPAFHITDAGRWAMEDFRLASRVTLALSHKGHHATVTADSGRIRLIIEKNAAQPSALADELHHIASAAEGVRDVEICMGALSHAAGIYRRYDPSVHYRVLLVDDEKEFVQTLAERLRMRNVPSHAVCSGETALALLKEDPPDLMVLDLKMPGVDGFEILTRVKKNHPGIAIIILSGHGTEADRQRCMELGAFAYLQKPTDINQLTATMKQAYTRLRAERSAPS